MTVIGFLYRSATADRHGGEVLTDGEDTFAEEIVGSVHSANGVVNLWRAIERDDDVVEESSYFFCTFVEQETCSQECEANLPVTKKVAERGEVVMQQWFAACENNMLNAKSLQRIVMTFQILRAYLLAGFALPDVAHDAAAVASAVSVQD